MVVTPLYAGLLAIFFLVLSWRVIQFRQRGIPLGDGGDPKMLRLIRERPVSAPGIQGDDYLR